MSVLLNVCALLPKRPTVVRVASSRCSVDMQCGNYRNCALCAFARSLHSACVCVCVCVYLRAVCVCRSGLVSLLVWIVHINRAWQATRAHFYGKQILPRSLEECAQARHTHSNIRTHTHSHTRPARARMHPPVCAYIHTHWIAINKQIILRSTVRQIVCA